LKNVWINFFKPSLKFKGRYDENRFRYIHQDLIKSGYFTHRGSECIRKTASFYSKKLNIYIDSSDGVNEDLPINEYCGRIYKVIEDSKGKPFLFFKCFLSSKRSQDIIELAEKNGGKVLPFAFWSVVPEFYQYVNGKEKEIIIKNRKKTVTDLGFIANLNPYYYPKPNADNKLIGWPDYKHFGFGSPENTGEFVINTRQNLFDLFSNSPFSFYHHSKMSYSKYISKTFEWKLNFCPPGMGEYTQRLFDHLALAQVPILRSNSYDFYASWKKYIPEMNFNSPNWEEKIQSILDDRKLWKEKVQYYYNNYLKPFHLVNYIVSTTKLYL